MASHSHYFCTWHFECFTSLKTARTIFCYFWRPGNHENPSNLKKSTKVILLIFLVLIIDQAVKIWVKTHMYLGEEIPIFGSERMLIHFVENNGMAFGLTLGGEYGKLALSLFRIIAVGFLGYYIHFLIKHKATFGLLACFGLILAGALGNILDSAFYGLIFSESSYHHAGVAEMFPEQGYAGFLHGKVVDMLYFPLIEGTYPDWLPFKGGESFRFFRPVFNLADTSITIGVLSLVLFHRNFFSGHIGQEAQQEETTSTETEEMEETTTEENNSSGSDTPETPEQA
jgi:signal peptidase II